MTEIEMARQCGALGRSSAGQLGIAETCLAGEYDDDSAVQSALAMHTMRQAEINAKDADIAELVDALSNCIDLGHSFESQGAADDVARALIAKHRPDAFEAWADGLID